MKPIQLVLNLSGRYVWLCSILHMHEERQSIVLWQEQFYQDYLSVN